MEITKDLTAQEFIMIVEFAKMGSLRSVLSTNFYNLSWKIKIQYLCGLIFDLKGLHKLEYCHKDFHSGNILDGECTYLSDF